MHFYQPFCALRSTQLSGKKSGKYKVLASLRAEQTYATRVELQRSPFFGQVFEGFVAAEILKSQVNQGGRKELYYFRDQHGLEVDFLLPRPNAGLWLIECKAGKTVRPVMAAPLLSLRRSLGKRSERLILVHQKSRSTPTTTAVATGVEAPDLERFVAEINHDQ